MKQKFGDMNASGQWWDGECWRNTGPDIALRSREILHMDAEFGAHVDGCFTCPRCRRSHYITANFDYLCDGCVASVLSMPDKVSPRIIEGIRAWRKMASRHYREGGFCALIRLREIEREHLST